MRLIILDDVVVFLDELDPETSAKIYASLEFLEAGKTEVLVIKPLKGKIMELSVKQYRIIFCRVEATIYVVDGFKKQSKKTPLRIIERAERIYRKIIESK